MIQPVLHHLRCVLIYALSLIFSTITTPLFATSAMPKLIYWIWEVPQDMTSINPQETGIAELAASIYIQTNHPFYYLRQQPLRIPKNSYRIAVIHIEARPQWHPVLTQQMAESIAQQIKKIYQKKTYDALQIDFEALRLQRAFYYQLLVAIRKQMGNALFLSITGIGSWCTTDGWIGKAKLPVDLVVPMYFSLSNDIRQRQAFIDHFPKSIKHLAPECQSAIGLATFEKWQLPLKADVPVFAFTKGRWNAQTLQQAKQLAFTIQH